MSRAKLVKGGWRDPLKDGVGASDCAFEDPAGEEDELIAEQGIGGDAGGDIRRKRRNARIEGHDHLDGVERVARVGALLGESMRMPETFPAIAPAYLTWDPRLMPVTS